jgi:predicted regulator of Ras-like GTPase activity (Roadblock/LC7/MglB family)
LKNSRELLHSIVGLEGALLGLVCSSTGRVKEQYVNEQEFSASTLGLNISMLYNTALEVAQHIGLQAPDYHLIHCQGYYLLTVKINDDLLFIVLQDNVDLNMIFQTVNAFIQNAIQTETII